MLVFRVQLISAAAGAGVSSTVCTGASLRLYCMCALIRWPALNADRRESSAACAAGEDVTSACAATAKRGGVVRGGVVRRTPTGGCGYVALRAALWMCGLSPTIGKRTRQKTQKTQSKCRRDWHQKSRRCRRPRMGGGCVRGSRPLASGELTS